MLYAATSRRSEHGEIFIEAVASSVMDVETVVKTEVGQHTELDVRRRRLLFRSWHRGTQESDFILGSFADKSLDALDSAQLDKLEALLDLRRPRSVRILWSLALPTGLALGTLAITNT